MRIYDRTWERSETKVRKKGEETRIKKMGVEERDRGGKGNGTCGSRSENRWRRKERNED